MSGGTAMAGDARVIRTSLATRPLQSRRGRKGQREEGVEICEVVSMVLKNLE